MADKPLNDAAASTLQFLLGKFNPSVPALNEQDAIENSAAFRKAAKDAYFAATLGTMRGYPTEAGFAIGGDGKASPIALHRVSQGENGEINQTVTPDTIALVHTHPDVPGYGQQPSPADIAAAKQIKRPIMVLSRTGLYEIDALGNVRQVFKGTNWMNKKKKKR